MLENAGCLKRTYGGAILSQDYPLNRDVVDRRNVNVEKKAAIAEKALGLIRDNETIFLDISPQTLNWQNFGGKTPAGGCCQQYDRHSPGSGQTR